MYVYTYIYILNIYIYMIYMYLFGIYISPQPWLQQPARSAALPAAAARPAPGTQAISSYNST